MSHAIYGANHTILCNEITDERAEDSHVQEVFPVHPNTPLQLCQQQSWKEQLHHSTPCSSVYVIPEGKEGIGADRNFIKFANPFLLLCFS